MNVLQVKMSFMVAVSNIFSDFLYITENDEYGVKKDTVRYDVADDEEDNVITDNDN